MLHSMLLSNVNEVGMSVNFNHTIVYAHDSRASATFLAEVLGLPAPTIWGPFQVVTTDNGKAVFASLGECIRG